MKNKNQLLIEKLEYLATQNKNYTKQQYYTILECLDIVKAQAVRTGAERYAAAKESARQQAIEWQIDIADRSPSYAEMWESQEHFEKVARRFGLVKEFREKGII